MGVLPQVATATSAFMILFTSSATSIQFIIMGTLPLKLALWYAMVGFLSGILGLKFVGYLIRKYKKTSLIIFILAGVIGLSALVMGLVGIYNVSQHEMDGFHSICHH